MEFTKCLKLADAVWQCRQLIVVKAKFAQFSQFTEGRWQGREPVVGQIQVAQSGKRLKKYVRHSTKAAVAQIEKAQMRQCLKHRWQCRDGIMPEIEDLKPRKLTDP